MINGYMSIKAKLGREWAIPVDAERPTDERVTTGEYKNWRKKSVE